MPAKKAATKKPAAKRKPPAKMADTEANRKKAIADLGINVPIYRTRVVGNRLELALYGGRVLLWPETPAERKLRLGPPPPPPEPVIDPREPDEWHKPLPVA